MEDLQKLVRIVTNKHPKNAPLLDLKGKSLGKEAKLFLCIKGGACKDDEQAAKLMYNCGADDPRIKMLKSRLRKKLLNHLFFLDLSDNKVKIAHRYEQECLTLLYQAKTLINEGEYKTSHKLLLSALKIATEAEFTHLIINSFEYLLLIYSATTSIKEFYAAKESLKIHRELANLEQEAQDLYLTSRLEVNKSVSAKKNHLPKLKVALNRIEELWHKTNSINIFNQYYTLSIIYQELIGDFASILKLTNASEELLQQSKINVKRFDDRFNKYMNVFAYLRVKEYTKGLAAAENYLSAFDRTTNNWFAFMENYYLMAMHAGKFDLAAKLYADVQRNGLFKKISRNAQERWALYGAYLYFVNPSEQVLKQSNYFKLISAVPEYSKDKQGFNVAILILQYMYYLKSQDTDALLYRIESLKKYAGRHLTHQLSQRNLLFFKLLTLLVKEDLNYAGARRKGAGLLQKLKETPIPGDAYAEIEIIPYEDLWGIILQMVMELETH
ncbi:hypothetical protein [Adhaeribacter aquaticus]|uniref:hypothetical protein n=1 Tax=Adhaeribacter aquaticus TaxID=299567 RepID=UPI000403AC74|nr:hypothetical protein [Adhaeribacter aquaticus]